MSSSSLPQVSVIVPAYNFGHLISQTLDSIKAQTYPSWECVVIDDGSTDDTKQVVAAYAQREHRIKYVYQDNQGLSAARNCGIRECAGEYVQFLDADDFIEERKLEQHALYLKQHAEVDVVYGNVRYFRSENTRERLFSKDGAARSWMPEVSGTGTEILRAMIGQIIMPVNAALLRRSVFERVGFFDEQLRAMEDWDFWRRAARAGIRFQYFDPEGTLALVRAQPESMSKDRRRMTEAFSMVQERMRADAVDEEIAGIYRKMSAQMEGCVGTWAVTDGHLLKGIRHLCRAGLQSRSMKWFAYALISPFVPRAKYERVLSFSISQTKQTQ